MLPHLSLKGSINTNTSCMESASVDDDDDKVSKEFDYFSTETGIILENEEEYDILNNETFGDGMTELSDPANDLKAAPCWEDYDLHNNETFGDEHLEYDWEAEHEKLVSTLKTSSEDKENNVKNQLNDTQNKKLNSILKPNSVNRNGYYKIDDLLENDCTTNKNCNSNTSYEKKENSFLVNSSQGSNVLNNENIRYNELYRNNGDDFDRTEILTNDNYDRLLKRDKWYNNNLEGSSRSGTPESENLTFSQGYSLFSSGTNLLQNAGIHIPSVTTANLSSGKPIENLDKKFDAMKIQSSGPSIPSVADLEKQWINDAASKSVITADCFRAYNSAFYVNSAFSNNTNPQYTSPVKSTAYVDQYPIMDNFREMDRNALVMQLQKMVYTSVPANPNYLVKNEDEGQSLFCSKINVPNGPPPFDRKSYPIPLITESEILMYNNVRFRSAANYADANAATINSFLNNNALKLNRTKVVDPAVVVSSETSTHMIDNTLLLHNPMANSNIPGLLRNNVFPTPPPGLTLDPSKIIHAQNAATLQSHQQQTSYLTLPPPQVLNGIITVEQQKQLMKMQKENNVSNTDEYAGMMTEREKYWLSGVQLLQINSMDPYKDDYYFTNYQARRKGNRNKNQNQNNCTWKNQHTKDYSPLQFENSLGRVQIGSVVAPRQVIDTYLFENSPKHTTKSSDILQEDPIANTSSRKRKAIMLHIENMYGKIMALEALQVNSSKNKNDPVAIKTEFESIVTGLREEILNLKDDFKIIMSIKKGKRLVLRFLSFCDNPDEVWYQIFEILDRIIRGDLEHCVLLSYLPYFRAWLSSAGLVTLNRIATYFKRNLNFFLQDKFSVSVIANMIEHAEIIHPCSASEEQNLWMEFVINLSEIAHSSLDGIQRPVVSVKPQVLRSHLLKCKKLENGYMSHLLKIFSNNIRK